MKKLFTLLALVFCIHSAKAQYSSVSIWNHTSMTSMYCMFYGNNPPFPCPSLGAMTGWVGTLPTGGYTTYTFTTISSFFPTTPPYTSTNLTAFIFGQPWSPGIDAIPRVDFCGATPVTQVLPTMVSNQSFTPMTIYYSAPTPTTLVIDIW